MKATLVIDLPETCYYCPLRKSMFGRHGEFCCGLPKDESYLAMLVDLCNWEKRPKKCPLKPLGKNLFEHVSEAVSPKYEFRNVKELNSKWKMDVYKDNKLVMNKFEIPKAIARNGEDAFIQQSIDLFEKSIRINEHLERTETL